MTTVLVLLEATGDDEVAKVDGANANETSATIRRDSNLFNGVGLRMVAEGAEPVNHLYTVSTSDTH